MTQARNDMITYQQFGVISWLAFGPLESFREKHRLIAVHGFRNFGRKLPPTADWSNRDTGR
jgi:hypothetical protein